MDYAACWLAGRLQGIPGFEGLRNWHEGTIDRRNDRMIEGMIEGVTEGENEGGESGRNQGGGRGMREPESQAREVGKWAKAIIGTGFDGKV
jgi:hypothetical protein